MRSKLIKDFIKERFNNNYDEAAAAAGISYSSLTNAITKGYKVLELANGDFIMTRKRTTIFRVKWRV